MKGINLHEDSSSSNKTILNYSELVQYGKDTIPYCIYGDKMYKAKEDAATTPIGAFDVTKWEEVKSTTQYRLPPVATKLELQNNITRFGASIYCEETDAEYICKDKTKVDASGLANPKNIQSNDGTAIWIDKTLQKGEKIKYYEFGVSKYNANGNVTETYFTPDTKVYDDYNVFNLATSEFTVPVAGTYLFIWSAFSNAPNDNRRIALYVNGTMTIQMGERYVGADTGSSRLSTSLKLNPGDKVKLGSVVGFGPLQYWGAEAHNLFTGILLTPELEAVYEIDKNAITVDKTNLADGDMLVYNAAGDKLVRKEPNKVARLHHEEPGVNDFPSINVGAFDGFAPADANKNYKCLEKAYYDFSMRVTKREAGWLDFRMEMWSPGQNGWRIVSQKASETGSAGYHAISCHTKELVDVDSYVRFINKNSAGSSSTTYFDFRIEQIKD